MRKPKVKPRGGRSMFNWWRRFKTHKPLSNKRSLIDKIEHGDFEYPDQFAQADWEIDWAQEELDAFVSSYKGNEDPRTDSLYLDIQRKGRRRYNKLFESAMNAEQSRLMLLRDSLVKHFCTRYDVIDYIMESYAGNTKQLFEYCRKNVASLEKKSYV